MTSGSARLILIRHGDTDWITGNKHASRTEVPLSKTGEQDVEMIRDRLVGAGGLIDPHNVAKMYVPITAPRHWTQNTSTGKRRSTYH